MMSATRRDFLNFGMQGLGATALCHLLARDGALAGESATPKPATHFPAKAKRVVHISLVGGLSHLVLIRAFTLAPASMLAPFAYMQLIWSTAVGYIVFGDFPDALTLTGAAIIAASGIYVVHRERQLARATRASATESAPPQG